MFRAFNYLAGWLLLSSCWTSARADERPIRVVVWDEQQPAQKQAYENFLGNAIADYLKQRPGLEVKSVRLDDPEQGLSKETLDACDVLIWWGHVRSLYSKDSRFQFSPSLRGESSSNFWFRLTARFTLNSVGRIIVARGFCCFHWICIYT